MKPTVLKEVTSSKGGIIKVLSFDTNMYQIISGYLNDLNEMHIVRDVKLNVSEPYLAYEEIVTSKVFLLALNKWSFQTESEHRFK